METSSGVAPPGEASHGNDRALWRLYDTPYPRRGEHRQTTEIPLLEIHESLMGYCSLHHTARPAPPSWKRCGDSPSLAPPKRKHRHRP